MHRTIASLIVFGILALLPQGRVEAAAIQFAQFRMLTPGTGNEFTFTNNGGTSGSIDALNVPVIFNFTAATGLSTVGRPGFLNIAPVTQSTNMPAITAATLVDQPLNLTNTLTLTSGMNGTGANFLTMVFTGDITGFLGGPVATVLGADNNPSNTKIVTYTSDFGTFVPATGGNSYTLPLTNITPLLALGAGNFLGTSSANVAGQFTGNFVPEPASAVLFGMGILCFGLTAAGRIRSLSSEG
jgi:hypothetical protein